MIGGEYPSNTAEINEISAVLRASDRTLASRVADCRRKIQIVTRRAIEREERTAPFRNFRKLLNQITSGAADELPPAYADGLIDPESISVHTEDKEGESYLSDETLFFLGIMIDYVQTSDALLAVLTADQLRRLDLATDYEILAQELIDDWITIFHDPVLQEEHHKNALERAKQVNETKKIASNLNDMKFELIDLLEDLKRV